MLHPALIPVSGQHHLCGSSTVLSRPLQRNIRSATHESQWRIHAFGGLFGGGKKGEAKAKPCRKCESTGSITCPGCKGSGKNRKNGNVFERWKCYDCQGFGQVSCPACGGKGLTPEQRGER